MNEKTIDLRSDTLTRPTKAMRRAMAVAEVGDDVFGEDPTVCKLEEMAAARLGKEAALFVVSGTMGNLVSQLAHCGRGSEMILGDQAHIFFYEQGGSAAVGGIQPRIIPNRPDGTMALEDIEAAIRTDDIHFPITRLITLENTHNRCGGAPLSPSFTEAVANLAHDRGLRLHVDGARIFNAAVALETDVRFLAAPADSVTFCISKGLAAPVGSVVCGTEAFIQKARRARKLLGGGMRQAGVLAAAGIVALEEMVERLREDHANAKRLAKGIAAIEGLTVDPQKVATNIVFFGVSPEAMPAPELVSRLSARGLRVMSLGPGMVRAVTHYHIKSEDVDRALDILQKALS